MRVLVLVPTTGALNRVLRITARPDLSTSQVFMQGDYKPLAISADYDALTAEGGPLAALTPPLKPGPHHLRLAGTIESGKSWELPVVLAHLVVARGGELADEPAKADVVLWSTGAVDLDLNVVDYDYKLAAKIAHSRATLQEAAAAGAKITAILPACEDASAMREALAEFGAQDPCVERVDDVVAANSVLERVLGLSTPAASALAAEEPESKVHRPGRLPVLLSAAAGVALAAIALGAVAMRPNWLPLVEGWGGNGDKGIKADGPQTGADAAQSATAAERPEDVGNTVTAVSQRGPGATQTAASAEQHDSSGGQTPASVAQSDPGASQHTADTDQRDPKQRDPGAAQAAAEQVQSENHHQAEAVQTDLPFPVQLVELRDPSDRSCFSVLFERTPPRRIDVAVDGQGRFRDSAARNLCGLELTLNPQSGAQGFDIDLQGQRSGFRLTPAGAPGLRNKIKIEFIQELRQTITYSVLVKFGDARDGGNAPSEPIRQLRHRIIGMTSGWTNEGERH